MSEKPTYEELEYRVKNLEQVEKALQESEKHLKRAQRISKMGFWSYDSINKRANWSDENFNIFGIDIRKYPDGNIPESVWLSILEDPIKTKALSGRLAEKYDQYTFKYRTVPINGKAKNMHSIKHNSVPFLS